MQPCFFFARYFFIIELLPHWLGACGAPAEWISVRVFGHRREYLGDTFLNCTYLVHFLYEEVVCMYCFDYLSVAVPYRKLVVRYVISVRVFRRQP